MYKNDKQFKSKSNGSTGAVISNQKVDDPHLDEDEAAFATDSLNPTAVLPAGPLANISIQNQAQIHQKILQMQRTYGNKTVQRYLAEVNKVRKAESSKVIASTTPSVVQKSNNVTNTPQSRKPLSGTNEVSPNLNSDSPVFFKTTWPAGPPQIQRLLSFTLKNPGFKKSDQKQQKIVTLNQGERVDFIESRVASLVTGANEDRRHIVGYDLMANAMKNMVKNRQVGNVLDWLQTDASWVDSVNAPADKGVIGDNNAAGINELEVGLTQWLRNATSFKDNLWVGPSTQNRSKGASIRAPENRLKEQANWDEVRLAKHSDLVSVNAVDKKSRVPQPFLIGADLITDPSSVKFNELWFGKVVKAYPNAVIEVKYKEGNEQKAVYSGAFHFNMQTFSKVSRKYGTGKDNSINLQQARKEYKESQHDPQPTLNSGSPKNLTKSLPIKNVEKQDVFVGQVGLGSKFPVQRKVSVGVEDNRADSINQEIVAVNPGKRPPISEARVTSSVKGIHRRHKVGYDLIAKAISTLFKGKTVRQAAAWLDHTPNWLDQKYIDTDRQPLVNGHTIQTVGGVEAMATQWLNNAQNKKSNFFYGDSKINMRKGRKIAVHKQELKNTYEGTTIPVGNIGEVIGVDKVSDEPVNFKANNDTIPKITPVNLQNLTGTVHVKSLPGTLLKISDTSTPQPNIAYWGAFFIAPDQNGGLIAKRVSRSYVPNTNNPAKLEQAKKGFLANQIDTPEPSGTSGYTTNFEPHFEHLKVQPNMNYVIEAHKVLDEINRDFYNRLNDKEIFKTLNLTQSMLWHVLSTDGKEITHLFGKTR